MQEHQIDFNDYKFQKRKRRWRSVLFLVLALIAVGYTSLRLGSASNKVEVDNDQNFWSKLSTIFIEKKEEPDPNYIMPKEEKDRLDILILGIRGDDDPDAKEAGAHLTDTIMVFSYDKITGKSSVVSIPRDLYVKIYKKQEKINAAYSEGLARNEGLEFSKRLISQITGVYMDHAIVIDFSSFEKIIDAVDGIDITLAKPFAEKNQWGYEFNLPAGKNHLNGKDALYYARSRFSTNDFDRARRQQEIIFALKDKLLAINLFSDPLKALEIFKTFRSNLQTDIGLWDIKTLIDLADKTSGNIKHHVISIENLVYESNINGSYVLLPKGDNFNGIKQLFQDILK